MLFITLLTGGTHLSNNVLDRKSCPHLLLLGGKDRVQKRESTEVEEVAIFQTRP
jgi:hypothetical protein